MTDPSGPVPTALTPTWIWTHAQAGFLKHFADLPDPTKYAGIDHFLGFNQPPTNDTYNRWAREVVAGPECCGAAVKPPTIVYNRGGGSCFH